MINELKKLGSAGFSLMEILIVLTLMGVVIGFVGTNLSNKLQEGRISSAKIQIKSFEDLLKNYDRDCNQFPTTEQGLMALVEKSTQGPECANYSMGGYLDSSRSKEGKVPLDPWGNDYAYESDGKTFVIISYGKDGEEGGEKFDADIRSTDL
ncbi:MAG: type II secretion system major pseudopilin GspG [Bacteriovoracaceae bacterium]|nr:type II secretion system major pseudopilin GspG [Bacteriovoracaceae bacterium]